MKFLAAVLFSFFLLTIACKNNSNNKNSPDADTLKHQVEKDNRPIELIELSKKIESSPANASFYNERAKYYIRQRKMEDALNDLRVVFTLDSMNTEYYNTLADYHIILGEPANAEQALMKALRINSRNTNNLLKMAELYYIGKKTKLSFQYINQALKINKYEAKAYYLKGMNYKDLKNEELAEASFQTAIEQNPDYYDAYIQLALFALNKNKKTALEYYNSALRVKPQSTDAMYGRAFIYQDMEEFDKALSEYREILHIEPQNSNASFNSGVIYYNRKRIDSAMTMFNESLKNNPNRAESYAWLGLCKKKQNKTAEAKEYFQTALKINPDLKIAGEELK